MGERVDEVLERLTSVESKVDSLAVTVDAVDKKVDAVDKKVDAVDRKVDAVDRKVDAVDKKVDLLAATVDERFAEVAEALVEQRRYTDFAYERLDAKIRRSMVGCRHSRQRWTRVSSGWMRDLADGSEILADRSEAGSADRPRLSVHDSVRAWVRQACMRGVRSGAATDNVDSGARTSLARGKASCSRPPGRAKSAASRSAVSYAHSPRFPTIATGVSSAWYARASVFLGSTASGRAKSADSRCRARSAFQRRLMSSTAGNTAPACAAGRAGAPAAVPTPVLPIPRRRRR